jgi:hypothetical protein
VLPIGWTVAPAEIKIVNDKGEEVTWGKLHSDGFYFEGRFSGRSAIPTRPEKEQFWATGA